MRTPLLLIAATLLLGTAATAHADAKRCQHLSMGETLGPGLVDGEHAPAYGFQLAISQWAPSAGCDVWGVYAKFSAIHERAQTFGLGVRYSHFLGDVPREGETKPLASPHLYAQAGPAFVFDLPSTPAMSASDERMRGFGLGVEVGFDAGPLGLFVGLDLAREVGGGALIIPTAGIRAEVIGATIYLLGALVKAVEDEDSI